MYQLLALAVRGWLREVQADGGSGGANLECGGLDSDGDLRELNSGIFFCETLFIEPSQSYVLHSLTPFPLL